ncbi:uncharacterized protein LOC129775268 [Toxorhynchites rutilus septentrionalis]|uniref:uncharacterized protein LOC129775268 n=1 Tax=Toxorhynchites rutilus septentrionalis TaxID=329112 RepID=UPI00247A508E|nr:uncharacterized protein LOC129775268 [Toxorhynchites rutilus septentrionalis]
MDSISLTDLRRCFFGPTLDESVLYGIECLGYFFGWKATIDQREHGSVPSRPISDVQLYKSCSDESIDKGTPSLNSEQRENETARKSDDISNHDPFPSATAVVKQEKLESFSQEDNKIGKRRSIISKSSSKASSKSYHTAKLPSSFEQSTRTNSLSSERGKTLEKLKKNQTNSIILAEKYNLSRGKPESSQSPLGYSTPRSSLAPSMKMSTRLVRTRIAIARVNEFDDNAKTYEILQLEPSSVAPIIGGSLKKAKTEIVFATLPDGSTISYQGEIKVSAQH